MPNSTSNPGAPSGVRRYPAPMAIRRGPLCDRCGSPGVVEVDDTHTRCPECSAVRTFTRMTIGDTEVTRAQRAASRDALRSIDARTRRAFGGASFFPYALDHRWRGLRRFGGHGGAEGHVTSLTLAFGDEPWDEDAVDVRVQTDLLGPGDRAPVADLRMAAWLLTQAQVEEIWRLTGVLRDDVRRAAFPLAGDRADANQPGDPTAPWDRVTIPVDGGGVEFAVLAADGTWVAQAVVDPLLVGITSHGWPVDAVGLRAETSFDVYAEGLAETRRRRRP